MTQPSQARSKSSESVNSSLKYLMRLASMSLAFSAFKVSISLFPCPLCGSIRFDRDTDSLLPIKADFDVCSGVKCSRKKSKSHFVAFLDFNMELMQKKQFIVTSVVIVNFNV